VNEEDVMVLEKQYIQTMDKILKKKKRLAFVNTQYKRPLEPPSVTVTHSTRALRHHARLDSNCDCRRDSCRDWPGSFRALIAETPCKQVTGSPPTRKRRVFGFRPIVLSLVEMSWWRLTSLLLSQQNSRGSSRRPAPWRTLGESSSWRSTISDSLRSVTPL
jgi:hypothetical protein